MFTFSVSIGLFYMFLRFVPYHAMQLVELGATELPRSTVYALLVANWFNRLLPFLFLASFPAAVLGIVLLAVVLTRVAAHRVRKAATIAVSLVGLFEVVACVFIVYAMHAAYSTAGAGAGNP